ncbi:ribonuclease R [Rhizosaccharibacter radicis]|uniref:Ribonuclease R n=1 Tax=Rhizosaccharibacter radicis TaxID=2782605 RepID=A0ABT1W1C6_9PROT|nr:ribonuclease R [Acetobacteraceae bacterium KSS12]
MSHRPGPTPTDPAHPPATAEAEPSSPHAPNDRRPGDLPAPGAGTEEAAAEPAAEPDALEPALPSRAAIRRFIQDSGGRVGRREIERAFGLGVAHRRALRQLLSALAAEGAVAPAGTRRFQASGRLPDATVVVVTGTDNNGDPIARPVDWRGDGPPPLVLMHPEPRGQAALAPGERVLARLRPLGGRKGAGPRFEGRTVRRLADAPPRLLGVFRPAAAPPPGQRQPEAGRLEPVDKRARAEWRVPAGEDAGAVENELVLAEPLPQDARYGLRPAKVVERLGPMGEARSVSLLCLHAHGIPQDFPPEALADAAAGGPVTPDRRTDLRAIPLVTIDGADARDFDDAVHAEPVAGGGFRLLVAIADVAHYVRPGSALDREALRRGNSVYFPDRVVPMLPEALSNGWCSLKPDEPRGCLFAEMRIGADGIKLEHRFGRGVMRSAARLTYEQAQSVADGAPLPDTPPLPDGLIEALFGAYRALADARARRGTLDLDLPERQVRIGADGKVASITPRARLDSHRLIEEFMVLANVAAAQELERLKRPLLFRVHAPPSEEKLDALRAVLGSLGIALKPSGELRPADLDRVLEQVRGTGVAPLVNECVLRSQSQAEYSPANIGHFGLALGEYAHFTSPIRRYADLVVHRALIAGLGLGPDGQRPEEAARLEDVGEQVTATERRAALAERDAVDRYIAAHLHDKIGARFPGRISGVTRFGVFVTLDETGATGLLPVSSLPDDSWMHLEPAQALVGRRTGARFTLADPITVVLADAAPVTGALLFAPEDATPPARTAPHARNRSRPAGPHRSRRA